MCLLVCFFLCGRLLTAWCAFVVSVVVASSCDRFELLFSSAGTLVCCFDQTCPRIHKNWTEFIQFCCVVTGTLTGKLPPRGTQVLKIHFSENLIFALGGVGLHPFATVPHKLPECSVIDMHIYIYIAKKLQRER